MKTHWDQKRFCGKNPFGDDVRLMPAEPLRGLRGRYIQCGEEHYHYGICTFATGKQYSCDLNASYHIGARYFIRELLKSLPETVRPDVEAKVSLHVRREAPAPYPHSLA